MTPEITLEVAPEVAPEMTPETLSGAQSLDEPAQQPSVYRERGVRDVVSVSNSSSSSLSIDIIQTDYEPGLTLIHYCPPPFIA